MERILQQLKKFPGFKISASHYKIGSKLHISDFYYAKRIFQNSFFSSRFAFLIALDIIRGTDRQNLVRYRQKGLTLVGYGLYSELVLSLVEKFLKKELDFSRDNINHVLVNDDGETELVREDTVFPNFIIIVPIACTFSTSVKIEELIRRRFGVQVAEPHYNILHITGSASAEPMSPIEEDFGWCNKDAAQRMVEVRAFFEKGGEPRKQRYFIQLPTVWQKIENCGSCYPVLAGEPLTAEKSLFETERSAVTPNVIFDFPESLVGENRKDGFILNTDMLNYGHFSRNNAHFIYSINTERFLRKNMSRVKNWLNDVVKPDEVFDKSNFPDSDHVIIISSCHQNNTAFINLINERLFLSSANIIHYDAENDFIQNFEMTYGYDISIADKIVYIDDLLKSGDTFSMINEFVQFVLRKKNKDKIPPAEKGIDAVIVLINETNLFGNSLVESKIAGKGRIFSFANLNLFYALTGPNKLLPGIEKKKYVNLLENSFLESLKLYFNDYYYKNIEPVGFRKPIDDYQKLVEKKDIEKHLIMLQSVHAINQFLAHNKKDVLSRYSFRDFREQLNAHMESSVEPGSNYAQQIAGFSAFDVSVLKCLTQYQFLQYEPLRRITFRWILELLDEHIEALKGLLTGGEFEFEHFLWLKILIRRSVLVNSNIILSEKMFGAILEIYKTGGIKGIETRITVEGAVLSMNSGNNAVTDEVAAGKLKAMIRNLREFHVFFAAQIKELLVRNEVRAVRLEELLIAFSGKGPAGFKQVIRMLRAENTTAIQLFYEYISSGEKWKEMYASKVDDAPVDDGDEPIITLLQDEVIVRHLRYQTLWRFFVVTNQPVPEENNAFLKYLWIQYFLEYDQKKGYILLSDKTDTIFKKIRQIFTENHNVSADGIFLIVKDSQGKPLLVYDKNHEGNAVLESNEWYNDGDIYLQRFLEGVKDPGLSYNKTLVELKKDKRRKKWIDLYAIDDSANVIDDLSYDFLPGRINRLILLRLSSRQIGKKEKILGLIGIYFNSGLDDTITDANRIRYLLLLKDRLTLFIGKHHQNNEFRELLIAANTKKLALLSGHGKDMLKDLANVNQRYSDIALNLEHLQLIILLNEDVKAKNGFGYENIKKRFDQFYSVRGYAPIDKEYLQSLKAMAEEIYDRPEVEIRVPVNVDLYPKADFDWSFVLNKSILDLILFEVFINAKKNRWHFCDGETIKGITMNQLEIKFEVEYFMGRKQLVITVSNTGPGIRDKEIFTTLTNQYRNIKVNDSTAGTSLLKSLIYKILGGSIEFSQQAVCGENNFYLFTVTIKLNEIDAQH